MKRVISSVEDYNRLFQKSKDFIKNKKQAEEDYSNKRKEYRELDDKQSNLASNEIRNLVMKLVDPEFKDNVRIAIKSFGQDNNYALVRVRFKIDKNSKHSLGLEWTEKILPNGTFTTSVSSDSDFGHSANVDLEFLKQSVKLLKNLESRCQDFLNIIFKYNVNYDEVVGEKPEILNNSYRNSEYIPELIDSLIGTDEFININLWTKGSEYRRYSDTKQPIRDWFCTVDSQTSRYYNLSIYMIPRTVPWEKSELVFYGERRMSKEKMYDQFLWGPLKLWSRQDIENLIESRYDPDSAPADQD